MQYINFSYVQLSENVKHCMLLLEFFIPLISKVQCHHTIRIVIMHMQPLKRVDYISAMVSVLTSYHWPMSPMAIMRINLLCNHVINNYFLLMFTYLYVLCCALCV